MMNVDKYSIHGYLPLEKSFTQEFAMFALWILVVAFLGTNPIRQYVSGGTETMQTFSSATPQTKTQTMESTKQKI